MEYLDLDTYYRCMADNDEVPPESHDEDSNVDDEDDDDEDNDVDEDDEDDE